MHYTMNKYAFTLISFIILDVFINIEMRLIFLMRSAIPNQSKSHDHNVEISRCDHGIFYETLVILYQCGTVEFGMECPHPKSTSRKSGHMPSKSELVLE